MYALVVLSYNTFICKNNISKTFSKILKLKNKKIKNKNKINNK